MKNVLILSSQYPFGTGETYLEAELEIAKEESNIFIMPIGVFVENDNHRLLPENVTLLFPEKPNFNKFSVMFTSIFSAPMFFGIKELINSKKFSFNTIKELFKFVYASKVHKLTIQNTIKDKIKLDDSLVLYSYWMNSVSLSATYFKKYDCKAICRAHGADLYDYRTPFNHQFLRKYLIKNLDYIFPVSEDGVRHLKQKSKNSNNIVSMHLGTFDNGNSEFQIDNEFILVSCSNAVKLKRIDLIIDALSKMESNNIRWIHFGDGVELEALKLMAKEKLQNLNFEFKGNIPNLEIRDFYKTSNVDLFINVSSTEGVPVSIMEAISFGIPVIATNVGGVSELIKDNYNGCLIDPNSSSEDVKKHIEKVMALKREEYLTFRKNARNSFLEFWESEKQFKKFYNFINKI